MLYRKLLLLIFIETCVATSNSRFPKNFMFGCATAAFQIEGAWNEDGKTPSVWDTKNHQIPSVIRDNQTADISCDSYHKYKEDIALLAQIGVTHYRFSISWPRILPNGFNDTINQLGVDHYRKFIKELKANNIEPMVTIYHGDMPQSLGDLGGFYNASSVQWLTDYARVLFDLYGDDVKIWFTINEPYETCIWDGVVKAYECSKNLLKIHASIWHLYDSEYRAKQAGAVSIPLNLNWYEPETNSTADIEAANTKLQFSWGFFGHPIYKGDWPEVMKRRIAMRSRGEGFEKSRLPEFTEEEIEFIRGTSDFFSANTYTTSIIRAEAEPPFGEPTIETDVGVFEYQRPEWQGAASSWLKVTPWGIKKLLVWLYNEYDKPQILVSENGYSDSDGRLDDPIRVNYLRDYLSNIREAMEEGVDVIGYVVWTLIDNFEWNAGYTERFGLVQVDFNDPNRTRTRKNSSYYYEKVCRTRCLVDECI
uniref:Glycoside hydrolase family 1 n=1 Tax=Phyllotreta striolata TaxID=444603 RepID=A0A059UDL9_PHYSR|nr:glycoside hydrolase family 1 [Phyllotreta striolata]